MAAIDPPLPPMEGAVDLSSWTLRRLGGLLVAAAAVGLGVFVKPQLLVGFLFLAVLFGVVEAVRPVNRYGIPRPAWLTDAAHFFATGTLGTAGLFVLLAVPYLVYRRSGIEWWDPIGDHVPGWLQLPVVLLVTEVSGYWGHRLSHTVPWWWRLHAVHHSIRHMDWLASPRQHPLDKALTEAFRAAPLLLLGVSREMFGAFLVFAGFQAILIHANVDVRIPVVRHLIATPEFHHWHHAHEPEAINKNFAGELPWMDRIFGTYHLPDRWPLAYGCDAPVPETGWWAQIASPFRRDRASQAPPAGA